MDRNLADECVDTPIVARLRSDGHTIMHVAEIAQDIFDDEVLDLANSDHRVLMTGDKDFGKLVFRLRQAAEDVVLSRMSDLSHQKKGDVVSEVSEVSEAIAAHGNKMHCCFTSNYSGPNQYFPRNTLFSPPKGEKIVCFALEKWLA